MSVDKSPMGAAERDVELARLQDENKTLRGVNEVRKRFDRDLIDENAALTARLTALEAVAEALDELDAANADWKRVSNMPVTEVIEERSAELPQPPSGAGVVERANYSDALYRPYRQRVKAAERRLANARAALPDQTKDPPT